MKNGTTLTKEYLIEYLDPKFKQINDRFKRIESNYVTKDYLDKALSNYVTIDYLDKTLSNFVTKDYFSKEVSSIRSMLHESITVSMDNMKEYYKEETERYLGVLMESYRNESVVMKENISILNDKFYDYEERLVALETV
jgi:hypothetical protein